MTVQNGTVTDAVPGDVMGWVWCRISERTVSYSGGALFLVFALHGLWQGGSGLHNA